MNPKRGATKRDRMDLYRKKQEKKRQAQRKTREVTSRSTRQPVLAANGPRFSLSFDTLCRIFGGTAKHPKKEEAADDATTTTT